MSITLHLLSPITGGGMVQENKYVPTNKTFSSSLCVASKVISIHSKIQAQPRHLQNDDDDIVQSLNSLPM